MEWFMEYNPVMALEEILQNLTLGLVSSHDLARLPEAVFHAFVLGLLANLRSVYDVRSNAESGLGRADILMIPKTITYPVGYVFEFKSVPRDEDIEASARCALDQIRDKQYDTHIASAGIVLQQVRRLAIILQGKRVIVREHALSESCSERGMKE